MRIKSVIWLLGASVCCLTHAQQPGTPYTNTFSQAALDTVPEDLLVLDGAFAVKEEQGNKFLQLPGAPLDSFGLLFGPTAKEGASASLRVAGTAKGRRFPTFALGLNGVAGYRLQVSPAKKLLELYRGDVVKTNAPYQWQSGSWTQLDLQVTRTTAGWKIQGKAWTAGSPEPADPLITLIDPDEPPPGRAGLFASPFSGTPLQFDDLVVKTATPK